MNRKIIFVLLTISAIICATYNQPGLKPKPQIYFISFSALTTLLLFTKIKIVPAIMYSLLIGLMLYLMYFVLCMFVIDLIAPDRAIGYLEDGRKVRFNDNSYIYAVYIGFALSLVTLALYVRNRKRADLIKYEKYFGLLTLVVTAIGYCIYEL